MARRKNVKASVKFRVQLPIELVDRLIFLAQAVGTSDVERTVERAVCYFDRAVCATLDGAKITMRHRTDKVERFDP